MAFRNELEAKEAQLERLRRENQELRDELDARQAEPEDDALPDEERASSGLEAAKARRRARVERMAREQAEDRPTPRYDASDEPLARHAAALGLALLHLSIVFTMYAALRYDPRHSTRSWLGIGFLTLFMGGLTLGAGWSVFITYVAYGQAPDGRGGWKPVSGADRWKRLLMGLAGSLFVGLLGGLPDDDFP